MIQERHLDFFFPLLAFSPSIEKGPSKQSLVTVSFSPMKCHFLNFFSFHLLQLYMIFLQSFLKYYAVFENELNPESFLLYFSPLVTAQIH